jgi:uncharacterized protein (DUF362 family)
MSEVSIIRCNSYDNIKSAIKKSIDLLGGLDKFIKPNQKILLKPNLCDPIPPEKAATTHPLFIKAVIELVKEQNAIPIIGEVSAGNSKGRTSQSFEICGINDIARETNTEIRNFQVEKFVPKDIKGYKILEKTDFAQALDEIDGIINLPKLKTHGITHLTIAIKNFFGCVHPLEREYLHKNFSEPKKFSQGLVDIFSVIKPKVVLNIGDAVVGMQGDEGPSYGETVEIGYVITGKDAVSVDAVSSKLTNHRPLAIPTTYDAYKRNLGEADLNKIQIKGDKLEINKKFRQHSIYLNRNKNKKTREFVLQPKITEKCVKCGVCFENCPVKAISGNKTKGFEINEDKCIQCYCCQEMCIHEAIKFEKKWLIDKIAPYIKGDYLIERDKKIKIKIHRLKLNDLNNFNASKNLNLISFKLTEDELSIETGKLIFNFLNKLNKKNINFRIIKPLPRCLFKHRYKHIKKRYNFLENCFECYELFHLNKNKMTVSCSNLNNRLGPKKEYFSDRKQIYEYFNTFYKQLKPLDRCKNCIYLIRGQCDGLCFRIG